MTFEIGQTVYGKDRGDFCILYAVNAINLDGTVMAHPQYGLHADGQHETYRISNSKAISSIKAGDLRPFDKNVWLKTAKSEIKYKLTKYVCAPLKRNRSLGWTSYLHLTRDFSPLDEGYIRSVLEELVSEGTLQVNAKGDYKPVIKALKTAKIERVEQNRPNCSYRINDIIINTAHIGRQHFDDIEDWSLNQSSQYARKLQLSPEDELEHHKCTVQAIERAIKAGDIYLPDISKDYKIWGIAPNGNELEETVFLDAHETISNGYVCRYFGFKNMREIGWELINEIPEIET